MMMAYFFWVLGAEDSACSVRNAPTARSIVVCRDSGAGAGTSAVGAGALGSSDHRPAISQALATAFASGHNIFFVFWRLNFPARVPSAYMGQWHFFHPLRSSSAS